MRRTMAGAAFGLIAAFIGGCGGGDSSASSASTPQYNSAGSCDGSVTPTISAGVYGIACYQDLIGVGPNAYSLTLKPIRRAVVEIMNASDAVVATSYTNDSGIYEIDFSALSAGSFRVRVKTAEGGPQNTGSKVVGSSGLPYAVASPSFTIAGGQLSGQNIQAGSDTVGPAFNAFDQIIKAENYIRDVVRPASVVGATIQWYAGSQVGTYYCPPGIVDDACPLGGDVIHLWDTADDQDGYDDSVILHEYGHLVLSHYSRDDSPGGSHTLIETDEDLALSWSEGFATAFQSWVQRYADEANPDRYLDRFGPQFSYDAYIQYDLEGPTGMPPDPSLFALGIGSEVAVSVVLWDLVDTINEEWDAVAAETAVWEEIKSLPTWSASNQQDVSFQAFWQQWLSNARPDVSSIVENREIFMAEDAYEPDDAAGQAQAIVLASAQLRTLDAVADVDWVSVNLTQGTSYRIKTQRLLSGIDTKLSLYQSNGTTLIAANDDAGSGDLASLIQFTPSTSGTYLIKVERYRDSTCLTESAACYFKRTSGSNVTPRYGSYELVVE